MRQHSPISPATGLEDPSLLPWTDGNPSAGIEGSYPGHALMTDQEAELLAVIQAAGLTPSNVLTQLLQALNILFVNVAGDVMTGNLQVPNLIATAILKAPQYQMDTPAGVARYFAALTNGVRRFTFELANGNAETGNNAGSNASITRYNDAGVAIDSPITISRATGQLLFNVMPALTGGLKLIDASLTNPGFVKLNAGFAAPLIIQWIRNTPAAVANASGDAAVTFTFPTAFQSTVLGYLWTPANEVGGAAKGLNCIGLAPTLTAQSALISGLAAGANAYAAALAIGF